MSDTLTRLAAVLEARKGAAPDSSYVASLYHKGLNKILEKVGEESVETILAAKAAASSGDCTDLIYETADLWFHSLVMLASLGQHPQAVLDELDRRFGLSGHVEKAARIVLRSALDQHAGGLQHGGQRRVLVADDFQAAGGHGKGSRMKAQSRGRAQPCP